jgi:hypothetical protein
LLFQRRPLLLRQEVAPPDALVDVDQAADRRHGIRRAEAVVVHSVEGEHLRLRDDPIVISRGNAEPELVVLHPAETRRLVERTDVVEHRPSDDAG